MIAASRSRCCQSRVDERSAKLAVHVADRLGDALAPEAPRVAVAQLEGFAFTGGGARGHRRPAAHAVVQEHVRFDRGIAARVEDLAAANVDDMHEGRSRSPWRRRRGQV